MNYNKAVIVGNLTRDPETRTTPSGQTVTSFGVATNRIWIDQNGEKQQAVDFHNVVAWGKLADTCSRYLNKGKLVLIEGRIQTRSWEGQDGVKRYRTEIVAQNMQMGPRYTGGTPSPSYPSPPPSSQPPQTSSEPEIPVIQQEEQGEVTAPKKEETPELDVSELDKGNTSKPEEESEDQKENPSSSFSSSSLPPEEGEVNVKDIPF